MNPEAIAGLASAVSALLGGLALLIRANRAETQRQFTTMSKSLAAQDKSLEKLEVTTTATLVQATKTNGRMNLVEWRMDKIDGGRKP